MDEKLVQLFYDLIKEDLDMNKYFTILFISFFTLSINAQSITEAVRYSTLIPGGTARVMGAGGSFGAMGGDFGVLSLNPAGLADYRSSELMFSFSMNSGETNSIFGNQALSSQHNYEVNLENLGIVFHAESNGSDLLTSNLSIGLQQYNNYSQDFGFSGYSQGTLIERFTELANGLDSDELDPFEAGLAFESGAIFDDEGDYNYESDIDSLQDVFKKQDVSRSGKINELVIAWGGKFDNNLSLGVGIGIPFISFEEDKTYQEIDEDGSIDIFNDLSYVERLTTSGTGINLKLGLNYTIENAIRLGLAYQSPSFFRMTDHYYASLNYDCDICNFSNETSDSPDGNFRYRLKTPMQLTGSIGALLRSGDIKGFINLDVQYINYTANSFNFSAYSNDPSEIDFEREINGDIDTQLQSTYNFNLGAELAFEKIRLRGGMSLIGSPYFIDGGGEYDKIYALGAGFRADRVFLDLAYQFRDYSEGYIPYRVLEADRTPLINNETSVSKIILTIGYKI